MKKNKTETNISQEEIEALVHDLEKIQGMDLSRLENAFLAQKQMLSRKVKKTGDTITDLKLYLEEAYKTLETLKAYKRFDYDAHGILMWRCNYFYTIYMQMHSYTSFNEGYFKGIGESGSLSYMDLEPKKDSWAKWLADCEFLLDHIRKALYETGDKAEIVEGIDCLGLRMDAPAEWVSWVFST